MSPRQQSSDDKNRLAKVLALVGLLIGAAALAFGVPDGCGGALEMEKGGPQTLAQEAGGCTGPVELKSNAEWNDFAESPGSYPPLDCGLALSTTDLNCNDECDGRGSVAAGTACTDHSQCGGGSCGCIPATHLLNTTICGQGGCQVSLSIENTGLVKLDEVTGTLAGLQGVIEIKNNASLERIDGYAFGQLNSTATSAELRIKDNPVLNVINIEMHQFPAGEWFGIEIKNNPDLNAFAIITDASSAESLLKWAKGPWTIENNPSLDSLDLSQLWNLSEGAKLTIANNDALDVLKIGEALTSAPVINDAIDIRQNGGLEELELFNANFAG